MNILKNPLLYFVVAGFLAFAVYNWLQPEDKEEIRVTPQVIADLVAQDEALSLRKPDDAKKKELIENYIQEEIMLREAFALGYHISDGRVRKRLLRLMRTSLQDQIPEPTYNQLKAFYEENRQDYALGESRTFLQIFYDPSLNANVPDLEHVKEQYASYEGEERVGDFGLMSNRLNKDTYEDTGRAFGKEFADAVFNADINIWYGPLTSVAGSHYIKVLEVHPAKDLEFEKVEQFVAMDYTLEKNYKSREEKIELLKEKYIIIIEPYEE